MPHSNPASTAMRPILYAIAGVVGAVMLWALLVLVQRPKIPAARIIMIYAQALRYADTTRIVRWAVNDSIAGILIDRELGSRHWQAYREGGLGPDGATQRHGDTLSGTWRLLSGVQCADSTISDGQVAVKLQRVGDGWRVIDFSWLPQPCEGVRSNQRLELRLRAAFAF